MSAGWGTKRYQKLGSLERFSGTQPDAGEHTGIPGYRALRGDDPRAAASAERLIVALDGSGDEVGALLLEVVHGHDYGASRFLRGAPIHEVRIEDGERVQTRSAAHIRRVPIMS